jgi:hypothetical protein
VVSVVKHAASTPVENARLSVNVVRRFNPENTIVFHL